jgi:hypothetical protein
MRGKASFPESLITSKESRDEGLPERHEIIVVGVNFVGVKHVGALP